MVRLLADALPYPADFMSMVLSGIPEHLRVVDFSRAMTELSVSVRDAEGNLLRPGSMVGTGMTATISLFDETFAFLLAVKGDLNGDGNVNTADARLALRFCARLTEDEPSLVQQTALDLNGDGKFNTADARLVLRAAARLLSI